MTAADALLGTAVLVAGALFGWWLGSDVLGPLLVGGRP